MGKATNGILVGGVVVIALVFIFMFSELSGLTQLTALGGKEGVDTTPDVVSGNEGDNAILSLRGYDEAGDSGKSQVAGTLYVNRKDANGVYNVVAEKGLAMSSSTSTSVDELLVGETVQAVAFDSTYYGVMKEITIANERPADSLTEYNIATAGSMDVYFDDEDGITGTSDTVGNLTLSGSASGSIDEIKYKNNDDDDVYFVKGICFDTVAQTNISTISMTDSKWTSADEPQRLKSTCDYFFELSSAVKLMDYETFKTGSIEITADSDNPAETITGYFVDENYFQSTDLTLKVGYELDSSAHTDVGMADDSFTIAIH